MNMRSFNRLRHPKIRSSLAPLQATRVDAEAIKREGWRDHQILVISHEDDRLGMLEREFVRQIGNRLYGSTQSPIRRSSKGAS
jgi:hypothetical protein